MHLISTFAYTPGRDARHTPRSSNWMASLMPLIVPPDSLVAAPPQTSSRFLLVTGGALKLKGEVLPCFATAFLDKASEMRAGKEGLELIVLQFPTS